MSNKETCPGCATHSSSVWWAFHEEGAACPICGLSADAAKEIMAVHQARGDQALKAKLAEALERADRAEAQARKLQEIVDEVRFAVSADRS